jgi:hypothetical protein
MSTRRVAGIQPPPAAIEGKQPDASGWSDLSAFEGRPAVGGGASRRIAYDAGTGGNKLGRPRRLG